MTDAASRLLHVRQQIEAAARRARRSAAQVRLIAVSKTRDVGQIEELIAAGQRDFGESRVQEAQAKWPELLARYSDVRLHCIGRLQSNKAEDAVGLFDTIHSLDRPSLLTALVSAGEKLRRFPEVFVQVNIGEEEQKGGVGLPDLPAFLDQVSASPLTLAGLMGIPPLGAEPSPYFALLAKLADRHGLAGLSMGMSSDYEAAVMLGATAVRVGSALFED